MPTMSTENLSPAIHHLPEVDNQKIQEYYTRVLAPFEDTALFKSRLYAESSYLRKNPGLREDIASVMQSDDDQSITDIVELLDLSRQVDAPVNQTPFRALMAQLTLEREIDRLKIDTVGSEAPSSRENAVMSLLTRKFTDAIPIDQLYEYKVTANFVQDKIVNHMEGLIPDSSRRWFTAKADFLSSTIAQRIVLETYLSTMPEKDPYPVSPEQVTQDNNTIAELFTEVRERQRYGVKIGYKPQDYRPGSLVFSPPLGHATIGSFDQSHPITFSKGERYPLATVTDSPQRSFKKKIAVEAGQNNYGSRRLNFNVEARHSFAVLDDGALTTYHSDEDIAQKAARSGVYNAYRHLQAEILAGFIDLTTDSGVRPGTEATRAPKATEAHYETQSGLDIVRKLLVPRINKEASTTPTPEENPREVRLHGVVWHIRRLPEGWHASPEALALAGEARITLADGETFVRAHNRGSKTLGEVVTHQLISRQ